MTLRLALVGGPMYDPLYELLPDDVEIVVQADHPTLNRRVADLLGAGERIDVLSTHSKYAPSQAQWLRPLDGVIDVGELAPKAVELCRFKGDLLSAPRNIDVRVLWYRTDRVDTPPATWAEIDERGYLFGFPGRESGLFGTFFELVVAHGGQLFDDAANPTMVSDQADAAIRMLCRFAARVNDNVPEWHYDDVDAALYDGRLAMAAAWPGGYGRLRESAWYTRLAPAPYPGGTAARVSYAGAHAWAIPTTCGDVDGAAALIQRLCSYHAGRHDAAHGSVCAHVEAFAASPPIDETDALRRKITSDTIANAMITYPPLERFPEVEDAGWGAINAALRGTIDASDAVRQIQQAAEKVLA